MDLCPLSDRGDGFAAILTAHCLGDQVRITPTGPRGTRIEATIGDFVVKVEIEVKALDVGATGTRPSAHFSSVMPRPSWMMLDVVAPVNRG